MARFYLLALRKPSLLIPLPARASRGDQILNAKSFESQGFAMPHMESPFSLLPFVSSARIGEPVSTAFSAGRFCSVSGKLQQTFSATGLPQLLEDFQIVHVCGKEKIDNLLLNKDGYKQFEYVKDNLKDLFAMADIVISRAGANAICELLALRKNCSRLFRQREYKGCLQVPVSYRIHG